MTTKQEVIDLFGKHPDWSSPQFARHLGCYPEYVRTTLKRCGLKLARRHTRSTILELGEACMDAGLTLADIRNLKQEKTHG